MYKKLDNQKLKDRYNDIFSKGAYEKYFTFNSYSIFEEILKSTAWEGKKVLDIGCGEGDLAAMMSFAGASKVHAIDYSNTAIKISKERVNLNNVVFECMDGDDVTEKYDVIVMAGVLEHIDQPFDMLGKLMKDNLNKDGVLITASPSFLNPRGYVWMTLQILLNVPMSLSDVHFFLPSDFDNFAKKNNYKVENSTIAHDWGCGYKTILDFKKRLVNALSDANLDNKNVPSLLTWMEKSMPYFEHTNESGAIMVSKLNS
jgi:2-polyprenyl-3-methyl-5-hydroxy-6-metoxy-1,4-benzoquinol methylase